MCRWLVYFGDEELLLADLVTRPSNSIVHQSFADPYTPFLNTSQRTLNHRVNGDGFGFGWYDDRSNNIPCVFTSIKPSWNDRNLIRLAEHIKSRCVFAHVRAASPKSLIVETNCHPFQFGRILFMHNGCIAHWPEIKRRLVLDMNQDCYSLIQGTTDTEHAGALFVNYLPNRDPFQLHSEEVMKEALLKMMNHIMRITKEAGGLPSSLNFAITNGECTIATRFRNSHEEEPPSLYYTKRLHYKCDVGEAIVPAKQKVPTNLKEHEHCPSMNVFKSVVISSEPLTHDEEEWELLPKNSIMTVKKTHKVLLEPIEVDPSLFHTKIVIPEPTPLMESPRSKISIPDNCSTEPQMAETTPVPMRIVPRLLSRSASIKTINIQEVRIEERPLLDLSLIHI
eukprot:TRINITY_DN1984_c0_g1_i1.p1 TRINITY_DN1984_c0_g1~~TRINITY_DN1984_c0_g1_i1.p1  ORF type:complete len:395 (-),score=51.87 TRINITY_DN1984_c0_g1_i1:37-1221(-)